MLLRTASVALAVVLMAAGCTKTVLLTETEPVLVNARAPAPPPPPPPPEPPRVEVKKEKIQVNEKIQFELNSDKIKPESFGLLAEIAGVINGHPELKKLRVEGHTCNLGGRAHNQDLSKRRARAVRDHLVKEGKVNPARLEMNGYGFDKPIASNDTEDGRVKNRRVEFMILERDEKAETVAAPVAKHKEGGAK